MALVWPFTGREMVQPFLKFRNRNGSLGDSLIGLVSVNDSVSAPNGSELFLPLTWPLCHLPHSGVYFQGTTIGMAPIMSMCTVEQSGGIVMVSPSPSRSPRFSLPARSLSRLTQSRCGSHPGGVSCLPCALWQTGLAEHHGFKLHFFLFFFFFCCWLSLGTPDPFHKHQQRNKWRPTLWRVGDTRARPRKVTRTCTAV